MFRIEFAESCIFLNWSSGALVWVGGSAFIAYQAAMFIITIISITIIISIIIMSTIIITTIINIIITIITISMYY